MWAMRDTPFKGLTDALSASSDWASIDSAWRESEDLLASLRSVLPEGLAALVVQVRRGDPAKGIRGSQVTVIACHAAAAAKLRLALTDWPQTLRAQGWGIQHLKVTAQRVQDITPAYGLAGSRAPITARVRQELGALARDMPNAALQRALIKMSGRRT